jgi:hypothetical protein
MFLYVVCLCMLLIQVQCDCEILTSSRMQSATRMPMRTLNRRRASNRTRLLVVLQWSQLAIKSMMCYLKAHLRLLCNGRRKTFNMSSISTIVVPQSAIKLAMRALKMRIGLIFNQKHALPHFKLLCNRRLSGMRVSIFHDNLSVFLNLVGCAALPHAPTT